MRFWVASAALALGLVAAAACSSHEPASQHDRATGGAAGGSSGSGTSGSAETGGGAGAASGSHPGGTASSGTAGSLGTTLAGAPSDAGAGGEASAATGPLEVTLRNFAPGRQLTRFDVNGDQVDAHDGHLAFFEGQYWLYGTAYDCGFEWQAPGAPFCGFKAYSSPDLVHWHDEGFLFDAQTSQWQQRCDGSSYGCYRPKVVYNALTQKYVLWVNVYDNSSGFHVLTGPSPRGPFTEIAEPQVSANLATPAGLNDGDHALFIDDDGSGYITYTNWRDGGSIAIERLNDSYTSRDGTPNSYTPKVTPGSTEAPALFKRGSTYYLTYSDPNCGYCGSADGSSKLVGTGTGYRTATSPLGPWSAGKSLSSGSCGGQPSFVFPVALAGGETAYVYGSDLWRGGAKNEALANFFWGPLAFAADGSLEALDCADSIQLNLAVGQAGDYAEVAQQDASSGHEGFSFYCDIAGNIARAQSFVVGRAGTLGTVSITGFKQGAPNAALQLDLFAADGAGKPTGATLASQTLAAASLGFSARQLELHANVTITAGQHLVVTLKSTTSSGCYGIEYSDDQPYAAGVELYSGDAGATFSPEAGRSLKFGSVVQP